VKQIEQEGCESGWAQRLGDMIPQAQSAGTHRGQVMTPDGSADHQVSDERDATRALTVVEEWIAWCLTELVQSARPPCESRRACGHEHAHTQSFCIFDATPGHAADGMSL
jgi:hypothetical protein